MCDARAERGLLLGVLKRGRLGGREGTIESNYMIRASHCVWITACSLTLGGCPSDDGGGGEGCPEHVRDSLGYEYGFDCENAELVGVERSPEPPACDDATVTFRIHPSDDMLRVCYFVQEQGGTGSWTSASNCRPVACDSSADCPSNYPCTDSMCWRRRTTAFDEVLAACLAPIEWPAQCSQDAFDPAFEARLAALTTACPEDDEEPCALPAECRNP